MKRLSNSEWLIVRPALAALANYLRAEIESVAKVDAEYPPSKKPCRPLPPVFEECRQREALGYKPFYDAYNSLQRYDLSTQAEEIISLYSNSAENASHTLRYVEALLVDLEPEKTRSNGEPGHDNDETIAIKSNGPIPPNCFVWNKEKYDGLSPVPWRLVDTLWKSPNQTAEYRKLGEPVWDDREIELDKEAVGTARKAANRFFQAKGIPLKVAIKGLCVSLRDTSRE